MSNLAATPSISLKEPPLDKAIRAAITDWARTYRGGMQDQREIVFALAGVVADIVTEVPDLVAQSMLNCCFSATANGAIHFCNEQKHGTRMPSAEDRPASS